MAKPACGYQTGTVDSGSSTATATASTILSTAGSLAALYKGISASVGATAAAASAATALIYFAAIVAAIVTWGVIFSFYYDRCIDSPKGPDGCSAGVIGNIIPAFASTADQVFTFIAMHDRVDVVIKSVYWPLVAAGKSVACSDDADDSPIMYGYFHNDAVCNAGLGAAIGGGVGAVGGVIIAAVTALAIGCATWILCIFAILVAIILAIVAVVLGATAGGAIGKAASEKSVPTSTGNDLLPPMPLSVGDYVTHKGKLVQLGDVDGAVVFWFVRQATLHGHSSGNSPFSYHDPDANLLIDACPMDTPPIQ